MRPRSVRLQADQRLDDLGLPVALHAGDARRSRRRGPGRTRRRRSTMPCASATVRPVDVEHDVALGCGRLLVDHQLHLPADHQRGELVRARRWVRPLPTTLPRRMTVMRSAMARTSCSLWLMNTIEVPRVAQRAHDGDQFLGLLRRQHGGRLVEDEQLGVAAERLEDLDALLHADGQVRDQRVRVGTCRPVALGDLRDPPPRLAPAHQAERRDVLVPEHDVLGHREHRDEHEVLMHHADARRAWRRPGCGTMTGLSSTRISPSSGWCSP